MFSNVVFIGMPGAGKSTIGIAVAKHLTYSFIDTDHLIESTQQSKLQQIVDSQGHLALRSIEERVILTLQCTRHVIATGGSAVYSAKAMAHLKKNGSIIYLDVSYSELKRRIDNFQSRGIAMRTDQTFYDLFVERSRLYGKYADITVNCDDKSHDCVVQEIVHHIRQ